MPYEYKPYEKWSNGYKNWLVEETLSQYTEHYDNNQI